MRRLPPLLWVLAAVLAVTPALRGPSSGAPQVITLDVGHGSCTAALLPERETVLLDCGALSRSDIGRHLVAPFLWNRHRGEISLLVLSHSDTDHVSGVPGLLKRVPVRKAIVPPRFDRNPTGRATISALRRAGVAVFVAARGDRFPLAGGWSLEVLHPPPTSPYAWTDNEASLVVRLSNGSASFLAPGDIDARGAEDLRAAGLPLAATAYLVPHHGSDPSHDPALAREVHPRFAVVSCGSNFAALRVLRDYEALGAHVLPTNLLGATGVALGDDGRWRIWNREE